jgi:pyridoxal/pyridoxine/pyridoxamine kinase
MQGNMKPWREMTRQEKAEECRRIQSGYPDEHNQHESIERQIKEYEKHNKLDIK